MFRKSAQKTVLSLCFSSLRSMPGILHTTVGSCNKNKNLCKLPLHGLDLVFLHALQSSADIKIQLEAINYQKEDWLFKSFETSSTTPGFCCKFKNLTDM